MKTLRKSIEEVVTPARLGVISVASTPADLGGIVDDILKAISEYVKAVEEVECMLLELLPDSEFSIKRHPNENCTLIYSIRKE